MIFSGKFQNPKWSPLLRIIQPIRSPENPGNTVVSIGHLTPWPENPEYHTRVWDNVSETEYFGVTLTHELSWSTHVNVVATNANRTQGFPRRNLRRCPFDFKETAFISMVRPVLEYASPIWDRYLRKYCDKLKRVQRRAARFTSRPPTCPPFWSHQRVCGSDGGVSRPNNGCLAYPG